MVYNFHAGDFHGCHTFSILEQRVPVQGPVRGKIHCSRISQSIHFLRLLREEALYLGTESTPAGAPPLAESVLNSLGIIETFLEAIRGDKVEVFEF